MILYSVIQTEKDAVANFLGGKRRALDVPQRENINRLIRLIASGNVEAVGQLYGITGGRLLSVAFSVVKNRASAEDVLQESFMRIVEYAADFRIFDNGYGWLCKIVQNTAINFLKRQSERPGADIDSFFDITEGDKTEAMALSLDIKKAMSMLSKEEREAIYHVSICGFTVREAAEKMQKTKSSVQRLLNSGTKTLKNILL